MKAEVRLYESLWKVENPRDELAAIREQQGISGVDAMRQLLAGDSLSILRDCYIEPYAAAKRPGDYLQFQRIGYFMADTDSTADHPVFNKTVGLKDTWAKKNK